ncbi:hypothetical protein OAR04_01240 [Flavobacteriales bacterium]|nr:hypothetical protein [Flavobacteriales bacterium]
MKQFIKAVIGIGGLIFILIQSDDMIRGEGIFGSLFIIIFTILYIYGMYHLWEKI